MKKTVQTSVNPEIEANRSQPQRLVTNNSHYMPLSLG